MITIFDRRCIKWRFIYKIEDGFSKLLFLQLFNGNLQIHIKRKDFFFFQRTLLDKLGLSVSTKKHKLKNKLPKTEFSNNNTGVFIVSYKIWYQPLHEGYRYVQQT